jgi:hypothetical protein
MHYDMDELKYNRRLLELDRLKRMSKSNLLYKIYEKAEKDKSFNDYIVRNCRWNQLIQTIKYTENDNSYTIEDVLIDFIDHIIKTNDQQFELILKHAQTSPINSSYIIIEENETNGFND